MAPKKVSNDDLELAEGNNALKSRHSKIGSKVVFMTNDGDGSNHDSFHDMDSASYTGTQLSHTDRTHGGNSSSNDSRDKMNTNNGIRCTIVMILFLGLLTSGAFMWMGIASEQEKNQDEFIRSAVDSVEKIDSAFADYVTAASLVHNFCRDKTFTRSDFHDLYLYLIDSGLHFKSVQFAPNITHGQRDFYETEARDYYEEFYPHVDYQGFRGFNTFESKSLEPRTDQPFYFPIHYQEPIYGNEAAIDLDYYSSESRIRAVKAVFDTKGPSLTDRLSLVKQAGQVSRCGDHDGPSYGVVLMHPGVPLHTNPNKEEHEIEGETWPKDFSAIVLCVPDVLDRSTDIQSNSKMIYIHDRSHPSGEPVFLGGAEVLEDSISYLDEVELSEMHEISHDGKGDKFLLQRNVTAANRVWTITVMAVDDGTYDSDHLFVVLGGCLIILGSSLMALWVYTNAKKSMQYNHVYQKAERTAAIVTSLFPKNVARQMMAEMDQAGNSAGDDASVATSLAAYDANERTSRAAKIKKKTIADLFPDCTVMFADMEGFTAWSSMRDPSSVFHLLETIYSAFDAIADRRGVFKVETVGDCYVAVCGLPEPNKEHAVVMAKFARDCLQKLAVVTSKLEVILGPETSSLGFRFGLHSGPVTGGVLRGQRARFQLFGDTVNTAARIEATGAKGRIQISLATANLLTKAGKGHWVVPRDEKVLAKGIGMLQTCWLDNQPNRPGRAPRANIEYSERMESESDISVGEAVQDKQANLVNWHAEMLAAFLKVLVAQNRTTKSIKSSDVSLSALEEAIVEDESTPIEQMSGSLQFPNVHNMKEIVDETDYVALGDTVKDQLRHFVQCIAEKYNRNPFHNFEHASHVVMSVVKLLSSMDLTHNNENALDDPLARFTLVLASVVHDVDHSGKPNETLVNEMDPVAVKYKGRSVAEQNSLDICWDLLMKDEHKALRRTIYQNDSDLFRFREYLVHAVLVTDIVNKDLQTKRKERWNKVFGAAPGSTEQAPPVVEEIESEVERNNTRKTALLELVIQASDVSHTMQHWHIFRQYNTCLYKEIYKAFKGGHGSSDPYDGWYNGEIGFFKFYVIPLAERVKQSRGCGALGEELYQYACSNLIEWEMKGKDICEDLRKSVQSS